MHYHKENNQYKLLNCVPFPNTDPQDLWRFLTEGRKALSLPSSSSVGEDNQEPDFCGNSTTVFQEKSYKVVSTAGKRKTIFQENSSNAELQHLQSSTKRPVQRTVISFHSSQMLKAMTFRPVMSTAQEILTFEGVVGREVGEDITSSPLWSRGNTLILEEGISQHFWRVGQICGEAKRFSHIADIFLRRLVWLPAKCWDGLQHGTSNTLTFRMVTMICSLEYISKKIPQCECWILICCHSFPSHKLVF